MVLPLINPNIKKKNRNEKKFGFQIFERFYFVDFCYFIMMKYKIITVFIFMKNINFNV